MDNQHDNDYEVMTRDPYRTKYKKYGITIVFPNNSDFVIFVVQRPTDKLRAVGISPTKTSAMKRAKATINKELQEEPNG